jgi:hypothetical protein
MSSIDLPNLIMVSAKGPVPVNTNSDSAGDSATCGWMRRPLSRAMATASANTALAIV